MTRWRVHLMSTSEFPLLSYKLAKHFPHVLLVVNVETLLDQGVLLCRYNIAKHRVSRQAFRSSLANGNFHPPLVCSWAFRIYRSDGPA